MNPQSLGIMQGRLVPREGVPAMHRGAGYDDPRYRDAELLDYSKPGFSVVYVDSAPAPILAKRVTIRTTRFGARLEPARLAIGAGSHVSIRNDTADAHVVSAPWLDLVRKLAPGASLSLEIAEAGPHALFLLGSDEAEVLVFAAPGRFVVPAPGGGWQMRGVDAGTAHVHAWHPRFAPVSRRVEVVAGRTSPVDLALGVGRSGEAADASE